jgi:hypothetical protein
MSERFLIEAKNSNGIPITPPQDTRSEEGYLKDLTIEGLLTILASGAVQSSSGRWLITFDGFLLTSYDDTVSPTTGSAINIFRESSTLTIGQLYGRHDTLTGDEWVELTAEDYFIFRKVNGSDWMKVGPTGIVVYATTDSTSKDTGAIITEGGLGVEKSAHIGNSLHTGGLNIKGIYFLDTSVNANYTVTANVSYVRVDDSGAIGAGVTLPAATGTGKIITIKDVGGSAASIPISISRTGSDTIDDLTSTIISTNYGVLRVIDGASGRWDII